MKEVFDSITGRPCMLSGGSNIGLVKEATWIKGELHIHCLWPQEQKQGKKVRRWLADAIYTEKEITVLTWPKALKMQEKVTPLIKAIEEKIKSLTTQKSKK